MTVPDRASKEAYRNHYREVRETIADEHHRAFSNAICRRLERWEPWRRRETAAGFMATDGEPDLADALEWRLGEGLEVWLPRVTSTAPPRMEFAPIPALDHLEAGTYGILEPTGSAGALERLDLVLVPGVAFDRTGRRLGRGAGYYDRALAERLEHGEQVALVGVCYEGQLLDGPLPADSHDIEMDYIVTEDHVLPTRETTHDDASK